jgi:hypothetical protein
MDFRTIDFPPMNLRVLKSISTHVLSITKPLACVSSGVGSCSRVILFLIVVERVDDVHTSSRGDFAQAPIVLLFKLLSHS